MNIVNLHSPPTLINNRYQLFEQLGAGAMGAVYRALDRLTGETVALKRVIVETEVWEGGSRAPTRASVSSRLSLAREFRTLASLRHPYIISVLDYGFDSDRHPYFTMELLENAETIITAAAGKTQPVKLNLLVQILQALAYLHRRGILHRDLKPQNVLVVNGHVKVLDFGLSASRGENDGTLGTLAYISPEVLQGEPATEASDLYAVGLMAYEVFAGRHPFDIHDINNLISDITFNSPDVMSLSLDRRLAIVLEKLLAKDPAERYADARELIQAYADITRQPLQYESTTIRESFLQAAEFVGRETEFNKLSAALMQARDGKGSAWLVAGESGVGKSRLLDEMRTLALVQGAQMLRGQAVAEGGATYLIWREALRHLCLQTDLIDLEASVLKALIPDIAKLIERDVPDAPELDPQPTQERLLSVIESVFRRQTQWIVIVLEDLHWTNESLTVLSRLARHIDTLPLLIVGSYRDDERPKLPTELPEMQVLKLERLPKASIAALSASMLGEKVGRRRHILDLLERETEGNVFFIVEVVRVLAEEAGDMEQIGEMTLPHRVFAQGMQTVVERRLNRVPAPAQFLLQAAAIAGRQLDLAVLGKLAPPLDMDTWLTTCADATVLEVRDGRWHFSHDKLREALLGNLPDSASLALHGQIAASIEQVYADNPEKTAVLAHHWREAGNYSKEAHYSLRAGEQALTNGAYREAITLLERALLLVRLELNSTSRQALLEQWLGQAQYGMGLQESSRQHNERAMALLGYPRPKSSGALTRGLLTQLIRQIWHRIGVNLHRTKSEDWVIAARACERLSQICYNQNEKALGIYYSLLGVNLAERASAQVKATQARLYANMSIAAGVVPAHGLARVYARRAAETVQNSDDLDALAWVTMLHGAYLLGRAQWESSRERLQRGVQLAERVGNARRWGEGMTFWGMTYFYQGQWHKSNEQAVEIYNHAVRKEDEMYQVWGLNARSRSLFRLGQFDQALVIAQQSQQIYDNRIKDHLGETWNLGTLTQLHLYKGELKTARAYAERANAILAQSSPTANALREGYSSVAEFYLTLWEIQPSPEHRALAQGALKRLRQFARIFNTGKSLASTYQGWFFWLDQQQPKALKAWQQAITDAQQFQMPYDEGVAYYHAGRLSQNADQLAQAAAIFEKLGAAHDLAQAKSV